MFFTLFLKILPVYITILIGYFAGKYLKIDRNTISQILFYIANPIVILYGVSHIEVNFQIISLPILTWFIGSTMSLSVYYFSSFLFKDNTRNILAFSSGSTSMGYFGLPIAMALFDEDSVSVYVVCYIGMALFENSLGFYIAANGIYTAKECMLKLFRIPSSYAMILGFLLSISGMQIPNFLMDIMVNIRGTFATLGMMLLGVSIAKIASFKVDWKLALITITAKYVLWPLFVLGIVLLDKHFTGIYDENIYKALMLLAVIPVSGSSIMLANILNFQPDKATLLLLISITVGLFYVPLIISLFFAKLVPL
ncbi:permease [Wolbachia endosymbiont of Brugia malayi]|uniref:AEC family transporter n=1 Tax=unclassified Wolbachia TaxID=2640676 RepID=UPI00004C9505|nr:MULTISPECIES: AEC family transporter [unclassified Wolbachia]AAW71350.1 Predicted permease [Wolbachia endosymbiont strain TRS of Brugia malayi]QCB61538.1 permease [Wolbachia endosymbiont of Brugia malayi]QIT36686.1 membrane transport family protein [Wolbachia endosymbiont of Brugia pahangi]